MSKQLTDEQIESLRVDSIYEYIIVGSDIRKLIRDLRHYKKLAEERGAALEFYASEETYDIEHLNRHGYIIIDKDGGERARQALGKEQQP